MSHAVVPNLQLLNPTEYFHSVWKLTRAMLAAGWRYKASADALGAAGNKDTSANPANDKWAQGGGVNLTQVGAQTGTAPVIGAPSSGLSIVSSVSGFTANSVGRFLVITGALNAGNNGVFRITAQTGITVTIFNPSAVAESTPAVATWAEKQSGASASLAASGTAGAQVGRCIISGLTGMVLPTTTPLNRGSVGDHLTVIGAATPANNGTFRITRVITSSSVEIDNPSATADANNGSLIWVESSPIAQVYPASLQGTTGTGAWLVLQGPSTMKIPVGTNVPTGQFVRGELVTQTNSGATGTLLGVVTDTVTGLGFATIAPRLNGTGGGPRGWTTGGTDTLTGAVSGATITSANIVPVEYVRELVFWKGSAQTVGHIYVQGIDQNLESASRFSVIAGNAAVTNILAPGSSAGPGFPSAGTYCLTGTGGSAAAATGQNYWFQVNINANVGNAQILCADNIETATSDADGSFILALGTPASGTTMYAGLAWQRVDSSEEGDVDPYVGYSIGTSYDGTRTTGIATSASADQFNSNFLGTGTTTPWKGWRRRGFPTGDAFQQFQGHVIMSSNSSGQQLTFAGIGRVQHALQEQMIREPAWLISTQANQRMRKGTLRWMFCTEGGTSSMTYSSGQFVQLSANTSAPLMCGPWDGQSIAQNA